MTLSKLQQQKKELIQAGQKLYDKALVAAHAGNLSLRLPEGRLLLTAAGICKGGMRPEDILLLDAGGRPLEETTGQPSSELPLHLALYGRDKAIGAVVHAHPPFATALACSGQAFDWQLVEEARLLLGPVPTVPYYAAGSAELAQAVADYATGQRALLLANHGAVCWGASLQEALFRMEALEHSARIMTYARLWRQG